MESKLDSNDLLNFLENAESSSELKNILIFYIKSLLQDNNFLDSSNAQIVFNTFRDKIFTLFNNGEVLDSSFIYLALLIMDKKEFNLDSRFLTFINLADNMLDSTDSQEEKIMLIELGAIARICYAPNEQNLGFECYVDSSFISLESTNDGFLYFLSHIVITNMQNNFSQKSLNFIKEIFSVLDINFNAIIYVVNNAYKAAKTPLLRRNLFNYQLHIFWNLEQFFNKKEWLKLYPIWKQIFENSLDSSNEHNFEALDEAMYSQFFIYHMCGNSFSSQDEWRKFNKEISQRASKVYKKISTYLDKNENLESKKEPESKKIIAFLKDRIVENSPYKVEFSLIKNLLNDKEFAKRYEIRIYCMSLIEKSTNDLEAILKLEQLGAKVIDIGEHFNALNYYNSHLAKALTLKDTLKNDCVCVLISPNNGYGISDFLMSSNIARIQAFYSHGNFVYDIDGITHRLTHICDNAPKITHENYEFIGIPVKMDNDFYAPKIEQHIVENERKKYPMDKKIMGVITRLVKIDSIKYLKVVCELLESNKEWIYLACGAGNEFEIRKKLQSLNPSIMERFYFSGFVDSRIYGHLIDFWLDSFPMEQGESRIEYVAKNKGIALSLSKFSQEEFLTYNEQKLESISHYLSDDLDFLAFKQIDKTEFLAFSIEQYKEKANEIMNLESKKLESKLKNQNNLFNLNAKIKEKLGVKFFKNFLDSSLL